MDEYTFCVRCDIELTWKDYARHLEEIHVGPRNFEGVNVFCGECPFQVGATRPELMIQHCIVFRHSASDIVTDWERVLKRENERIRDLVTCGVKLTPRKRSDGDRDLDVSLKRVRTEEDGGSYYGSDSRNHDSRGDGIRSAIKAEVEANNSFHELGSDTFDPSKSQHMKPSTESKCRERSRGKREKRSFELMQCTQCSFVLGKRRGNMKREGLIHALTHDRSLHPFRCPSCQMITYHLGSLRSHLSSQKATESGCDGRYENIQTEEMIMKTRELLKKTFPKLEWDRIVPPGSTSYGINL